MPIAEPIAPFATCAVDVSKLLPGLTWPRQIELRAGKHMVRPRYEIVDRSRRRIAHVNVERADLMADPDLPRLAETLVKGYLLSSYHFGPGEFKNVVYLIAGSLIALLGSWFTMTATPSKRRL